VYNNILLFLYLYNFTALFTLRSLDFDEVDGTYNIKTTYYTDNYCTLPSFTLTATGYLVSEKSFARLQNTRSYQLMYVYFILIYQVNVTVKRIYDERLLLIW